jgi:hypothetical protein
MIALSQARARRRNPAADEMDSKLRRRRAHNFGGAAMRMTAVTI